MESGKNFWVDWVCQPEENRNDAVWYYGETLMGTAYLKHGEETYSLDIYLDGETLVKIPYNDSKDNFDYVRHQSDFIAAGIETDADLVKISDYFVHNSWFDLYADGEHLDCVTHEIPDAVSQAEAVLTEVAGAGGWEKYFNGLTVS